jgi:hypothetical protein
MWIFETHRKLKIKLMTKIFRLLLQRTTKNLLGRGTLNIFGCFCFTKGITKVVNHGRNLGEIVIYVGVIQLIEQEKLI